MHPRFAEYVRRDPDEGIVISELLQEDIDEEQTRRDLSLADIIKNSLGYEGNAGQRGHSATKLPRASIANQNERLPLWERRRTPEFAGDFVLGYVQDKYTERDNNVEIIDWRENQLILAEVAIRDLDIATAVGHINNVRDYHSLTLTTEADLNNFSETKGGASTADAVLYPRAVGNLVTGALGYLIEERDKTLWMKGTRMVDQKRFDLWYLEVFTWSYQPIPTNESKVNPNLKDRARDL